MDTIKDEINNRLKELVSEVKPGCVKDAMLYSLLAPGKRLRPLLFLVVLKSYDVPYEPYLDMACAIEMVHTYSLIHDDLPGMDNDNLRRGRPTCHVQFDEATAILAGDALLNLSMSVIMNMDIECHLKVDAAKILFEASGVNGMIFGQQQDINCENKAITNDELQEIHHYKTGELISASMQLGALIASKKDIPTWKKIGFDLGLAFQIQDDVLDVVGDEKIIGKHIGSDKENNKSTFVDLNGLKESNHKIKELFKSCYEDIYVLNINHGLMLECFNAILKRVK